MPNQKQTFPTANNLHSSLNWRFKIAFTIFPILYFYTSFRFISVVLYFRIFSLFDISLLSFRWNCLNQGLFPTIKTSRSNQVLRATDCLGQICSDPLWGNSWSTCRGRVCAQRTCALSCTDAAHHSPEVPMFFPTRSHLHFTRHVIENFYALLSDSSWCHCQTKSRNLSWPLDGFHVNELFGLRMSLNFFCRAIVRLHTVPIEYHILWPRVERESEALKVIFIVQFYWKQSNEMPGFSAVHLCSASPGMTLCFPSWEFVKSLSCT